MDKKFTIELRITNFNKSITINRNHENGDNYSESEQKFISIEHDFENSNKIIVIDLNIKFLSRVINDQQDKLLVSNQEERLFIIKSSDIVYFHSKNGCTYGATKDKHYRLKTTLEVLSKDLKPLRFIRINRSFLINIYFIKEIQHWFGGKLLVIMNNNEKSQIISSRDGSKLLKMALIE